MDKQEIAEIFEEIALLLELQAANPFRIRAYRNGARALLSLEKNLDDVVLTDIPGIGKDLAEKIATLVKKGKLPFYEKLKKSIPSGLLEMMQVQGLGGKKVKALYDKLKIKTLNELKKACEEGRLAKLKGFGKKTEQNILHALSNKQIYASRHLWWDAMEIARPILESLKKLKGVKKAEIAGSLRRKLETIGDLDFLVAASDSKPIMNWFTSHSSVEKVLSKGPTKASVKLIHGIQADIRIIPEKQWGAALLYFTGSKEHNIHMRNLAQKRKMSLSEYGFDPPKVKARSETAIFKAMGLPYIEPELREDRGEFSEKLPLLIEEKDIRGTFHNHTTDSDGRNTLKEMVAAAEKLGWEYIGIADHSISSVQAHGQHEEDLLRQLEEIKKLNASKKFKPYVFSGVECDILANGKLDFEDSILKKLDYVVVSIHNALRQDEKTITKRIIHAIENPYTTMLGHVTCRLLLRRPPIAVNLPKVIDACIANKKVMELNANPQRLDMDWRFWHKAKDKGLLCVINTDAHSIYNLEFYKAGVNIARKGWLEKKDVINTMPLKQMQKWLKKHV